MDKDDELKNFVFNNSPPLDNNKDNKLNSLIENSNSSLANTNILSDEFNKEVELNDGLDNSLSIRTDDTPIEGQIGIEELYIRQHDEEDQEEEILTPIENQVSLEEFFKSDEFLNNKQILNEDNFGIFNLTPIKKISEFFDNEQEKNNKNDRKEETNNNQNKNLKNSFDRKEEQKNKLILDKNVPKKLERIEDFFDIEEPEIENEPYIKQENKEFYENEFNKKSINIGKQKHSNEFKIEEGLNNLDDNDYEKNGINGDDISQNNADNFDIENENNANLEGENGTFFNDEEYDEKDLSSNSSPLTQENGDIQENSSNNSQSDDDENIFSDCVQDTLETGNIQDNEDIEDKETEKVYNENSGQDVVDGMLYKNLDTVLHESMIPYSEHVILDRALPRVEDGLKPVQRRILYSMLELGVTPDKPFRKSARIVGDCLGKYHPHGDSSVYDAMVRMAQPFNTNMLLVSGHGNFGSIDGDSAAAMRYTEARLAPISMELLRDIDKNTVKWAFNFDDTLKEPEVLPGRFPNLLVNGATGIAVGLATNIPPHNLAEVIDGVVAFLANPAIKLKEMLKIIKGPDFPTGSYILNSSELYQAYETGKGRIFCRAKMHIESNGNDKKYIVITEIPYQVNKSSLLQKIASFKDEDRFGLGGISEVRDESDRDGLRAVLRIKKDADINAIYKSLLKNTELQTTFGINMVAIANGKPKQMGLLEIISYYAEYQREIIYKRSKYELEQAKEREHILSGLIIAIKNIDAVVKIIKTSQNTTEAKKRLKEKFVLSDRQAQAILDMRLAKLTSLEVYKLEEEIKKLRQLIEKLTAIINSKKLQKDIVKEELLQIKRQYKTERKTRFAKSEEVIASAPEPKQEQNQKVVIMKSAENYIKCVQSKQYNYAQKEVTDNSTLFDVHVLKFETETNKSILAFTSLGNCIKFDVKDLSQSRYKDKGAPEKAIFKELANNETVVAMFDYDITAKKGNFIFLTKQGMIKKTAYTEYALLKRYYQGMKLRDDDEITAIYEEPANYTIIFVTKQGMVLNALNDDIPLQGRISGGVKGINLADKDYCIGTSLATDGGEILAVTDKGFAKRVLVDNVEKSARYRKGLKFYNFTGENGKELVFSNVVTLPYTLGTIDNEGILHYRNTDHIPIENRLGKGKAVDRLKKSTTILKAFEITN